MKKTVAKFCARSIMENTLGYELSNGGSIQSGRTKVIAGIQAIGQSHKLGPEDSNSSSATSYGRLSGLGPARS